MYTQQYVSDRSGAAYVRAWTRPHRTFPERLSPLQIASAAEHFAPGRSIHMHAGRQLASPAPLKVLQLPLANATLELIAIPEYLEARKKP
jgi:hypothetical protein